jgi:putative protein kinase ArgK-like GTPase of G3E family
MSDVHALLVEGVPGIGESTVIDALIRRHVASADKTRIRTLLHLSQTWTYGPLAPGKTRGRSPRARTSSCSIASSEASNG